MSETVEHRCHRAERCAERVKEGNTYLGARINRTVGLCVTCERFVLRALEHLPEDYLRLNQVLGTVGSSSGMPVSGTREKPIPIKLDVEALQSAMVHEATCWAESVAEVMRVEWDTQGAKHSRPAVLLRDSAGFLSGSLSTLLAIEGAEHLGWVVDRWEEETAKGDPKKVAGEPRRTVLKRDGVVGALELLTLHNRTRKVLGLTDRTYRLPEPCPECEKPALEHRDGSDTVECSACARRFTWDDYRRRTDPLAALEEAS